MAENGSRNLDVSALTWMVLLISIAAGLVAFFYTKDFILLICIPLVIFGVYEMFSSIVKNHQNDQFGTNESSVAVFWGFVIVTIGGAGLVFKYTGSLIITLVFALLMGAAYMAFRLFRK